MIAYGSRIWHSNKRTFRLCFIVYGANNSLDGEGEEFIGVTNLLEMARVWTKKNAAREAIIKYADFLIEQLEETTQVNIQIRSLKRLANGKLVTEVLEELTFEQNSDSPR